MNKKSFIIASLCVLSIATQITTQENSNKSKQLISFYYHSALPAELIARSEGKEIKNSGRYTLNNNASIKAAPHNTTILVGGQKKTDGVLEITASNVTVDLNNQSLYCTASNDRPTAIYIADNVQDVTIRNGYIRGANASQGFATAIHIGQNVSNVTLENLNITYCLGMHGAIKIDGKEKNNSTNISMKNVTLSQCCHGNDFTVISANHTQQLSLENISATLNKATNGGSLSIIKVENSQDVNADNISIASNTNDANLTSIEINNCKNAHLVNISLSKNSAPNGSSHTGIKVDKSSNVSIMKLNATSSNNNKSTILCHRSNNINIEYIQATHCSHKTDSSSGITLQGSSNVTMQNINISSNSSESDFYGVVTEDTKDSLECSNITLDNVQVASNKSLSGAFAGIFIKGTQVASIRNCTITKNQSQDTLGKNVYGIKAVSDTKKNTTSLSISDCDITYNFAHSKSNNNNKHVAGIYLQSIENCQIKNTVSNHHSGNGQCFGIYADRISNLSMKHCDASHNKAGIREGGIDQLPSAGLYLYMSHNSSVNSCTFMHNKSGNKNNGDLDAHSIIDASTSCSGHGIVNIGVSPSAPNKNNSFVNCLCQGNGTQISKLPENNADPTLTPQYQGSGETRRCWESEAFASGATEQNTESSSYTECQFIDNGLYDYVTGYGLCIANDGTTSIAKNIRITDCEAKNNNFYGFFDSYSSQVTAVILGSLSITNGAENAIAEAVESYDHTRNFNIAKEATVPYINITQFDRVLMDPQKIKMINFSVSI